MLETLSSFVHPVTQPRHRGLCCFGGRRRESAKRGDSEAHRAAGFSSGVRRGTWRLAVLIVAAAKGGWSAVSAFRTNHARHLVASSFLQVRRHSVNCATRMCARCRSLRTGRTRRHKKHVARRDSGVSERLGVAGPGPHVFGGTLFAIRASPFAIRQRRTNHTGSDTPIGSSAHWFAAGRSLEVQKPGCPVLAWVWPGRGRACGDAGSAPIKSPTLLPRRCRRCADQSAAGACHDSPAWAPAVGAECWVSAPKYFLSPFQGRPIPSLRDSGHRTASYPPLKRRAKICRAFGAAVARTRSSSRNMHLPWRRC